MTVLIASGWGLFCIDCTRASKTERIEAISQADCCLNWERDTIKSRELGQSNE